MSNAAIRLSKLLSSKILRSSGAISKSFGIEALFPMAKTCKRTPFPLNFFAKVSTDISRLVNGGCDC